jgi:hypothetical protein
MPTGNAHGIGGLLDGQEACHGSSSEKCELAWFILFG